MQTFTEHYFTEKFTSDLRRAFTNNFVKMNKVGVDLGKGKYKIVVPATNSKFMELKNSIAHDVSRVLKDQNKVPTKSKSKEKKSSAKQKYGKLYVKNVYDAEIDSGGDKIDGHPDAIIVYELSNGGRIAFITTEDNINDSSFYRKYIATNNKGNEFFRILGTTIQQIAADGKSSGNMTNKPPTKTSQELSQWKKRIQKDSIPDEEDEEPELKTLGDVDKEYGLLDITDDDFTQFTSSWGDGKRGGVSNQRVYQFRDKFKKEPYSQRTTGYQGYKYSDGIHEVYLLDTDIDDDYGPALVVFGDRASFKWAKKIGMMSNWSNKVNDINWRPGTIEDLPE